VAEVKTKVNNASVEDFINKLDDDQKIVDSYELVKMYEDVTGEKAKMWGDAMIGFGQYHVKSEKSKQEADWPLAAFSPRKQSLTLYIMPSYGVADDLLKKLGKYSTSKACLYIKRLSDVDTTVLKEIIEVSYEEAKRRLL
jgi:hypothetical protein